MEEIQELADRWEIVGVWFRREHSRSRGKIIHKTRGKEEQGPLELK